MRPNVETSTARQYECPACGRRVESPDRQVCDRCGGPLRNLSVSRDL